MDDTISRQAAIANYQLRVCVTVKCGDCPFRIEDGEFTCRLERFLHELPSAQRKGKWMFSPDHAEGICTNCHYKIYGRPYQNTYLIVPYNYCPNCGADMRGKQDG